MPPSNSSLFNSTAHHHTDKEITRIFWIVVCAITWIILFLMCISNLWTHFRRVICRHNQPEYLVHTGHNPHPAHSTEHYPPSEAVPPPMEKTCISAPRSKTRSKSNKPLLPNSKESKAKSQPKSDDQLDRIPVMTPQEKTDETVDTMTGPIKIPGVKR